MDMVLVSDQHAADESAGPLAVLASAGPETRDLLTGEFRLDAATTLNDGGIFRRL